MRDLAARADRSIAPVVRADSIPDLEPRAVVDTAIDRMRSADPEHLPAVSAVIARLDPARWTLEWYLPWWLGRAFELSSDVAFELVVSDVLGLASIRIEDDLADGHIPAEEIESSRAVSRTLYEEALRPYRSWFGARHEIWSRIETWMGEWRDAADGADADASDAIDLGGADPATRRLAARATPLRIPAFAVCVLAGREQDFATVDRCLDHALAALVLYDHLVDREDDLDAGCWNALVAAASPLPQTSEHRDRNRAALRVALMTDGAAEELGRRIEAELEEAGAVSEGLGCPPLTDYLRASGARARVQALEVDAHYRGVAEQATQLLFGDRDESGSRSAEAGRPPAPGVDSESKEVEGR
jgi:hypothetical protein